MVRNDEAETADDKVATEDPTPVEEETEEEAVDINELLEGIMGGQEVWSPEHLAYYGPATRTILITGEITEKTANVVCSQIQALSLSAPESPIKIIINTQGGDVIQALAIFDVMRAVSCPIITMVQGLAASAGFMLVQGGDLRLAFPNARLFFHEPLMDSVVNSMKSMENSVEVYQWALQTTNDIIRKRIKMSKSDWRRHFKGQTFKFFSVEQSIELGILDDLLEYVEKPKISLPE